MDIKSIQTFGALKASGYRPLSVKEEIRKNLIQNIQNKANTFPGILGYEHTVIPATETALLSKHNILFLGLRGQAKTRIARQMIQLLDPFIPIIDGSPINDSPYSPISKYAVDLLEQHGDDTPIRWLSREERYGEKLATPDVSVADLIGDIDPIKAATLKLGFDDEKVIHYGIIPRSNRGIFVINELPDLQARIQVSLFNILQEGDMQIRGFKLRMPLDILFVFTANPEDYTNRGNIVTPLKDRIESQIITHYPKNLDTALAITAQEAQIHEDLQSKIEIHPILRQIIEQIAFEARNSEFVDKKSGVSARLTIAAMESLISYVERRALMNKETTTQAWITDLNGIIPAITGKIELVYEGEQEGAQQVAINLLEKAIRTIFLTYFPSPDVTKKVATGKRSQQNKPEVESPYNSIIKWFDNGNQINIDQDISDKERKSILHEVNGLEPFVDKNKTTNSLQEKELLMEFVLYGLAVFSRISKKTTDTSIHFNDLMGSMMDFGDLDDDINNDNTPFL